MEPLAIILTLLLPASLPDDTEQVPVDLQAELISKVVQYDRNFEARAGGTGRVLVLYRRNHAISERMGRQFAEAIEALPAFGGLPARVQFEALDDVHAAAQRVTAFHPAVVVFSAGLDDHLSELSTALGTFDGMTVALGGGLGEGAVLGFELSSGRPRMLLNRELARRHNVDFRSEVLRLMRVIG